MKNSNNRVPTDYAITRKQKRYIARLNMEKEQRAETEQNRAAIKDVNDPYTHPIKGRKFFKHSYEVTKGLHNFTEYKRVPSYFAENWRKGK